MGFGESMKVSIRSRSCFGGILRIFSVVDYILFITSDVDVKANDNEIRDYKYVDKAELQAMFAEEGGFISYPESRDGVHNYRRKLLHAMVQIDCSWLPLWLVGRAAGP